MTKHTPGPWRFANGRQIMGGKYMICKVWMMRNGEGKANANVITAAPEMLEALEAIVELAGEAYQHWDADREMKVGKILLALSGNLSGYHPRIDAIHAIIAKAKGEQP